MSTLALGAVARDFPVLDREGLVYLDSGGPELADELEANGYAKYGVNTPADATPEDAKPLPAGPLLPGALSTA